MNETNTNQNQKPKTSKLVIAIIILSIAILLAAIIMPRCGRVGTQAGQIICNGNLFEIGQDLKLYMKDYGGKWPAGEKWCDLLLERDGVYRADFHCPGTEDGECHYVLNKSAFGLQFGEENKDIVFAFESKAGWNKFGGIELLSTDNHKKISEGCHILFADGSVRFVKKKDLYTLRWEP
jgi:prepilin-type processing-associated H-X9-DG protein